MNDSLDDLFAAEKTADGAPRVKPANGYETKYVEDCPRCRGTGRYNGPSSHGHQRCFHCKGAGKLTFKTSSEARAKSRGATGARKAKIAQATAAAALAMAETFKAEHPAECAWLLANLETNEFARSLQGKLHQYGSLTFGQLEAIRKGVARAAERKVEAQTRLDCAPEISISKVEEAFTFATSRGVRKPKLILDGFKFSPAGPNSKWCGSIYVTTNGGSTYLGRITEGKFVCTRECTEAMQGRILEAAADPHKAAKAYGLRMGACSVCGRVLTDKHSVYAGIGPICATKMGW